MFPKYPYIDLSDRNLDFLTKAIREMENEVKNFVSLNAVKYANPIQWSINRQYEKNTIVMDPLTGTAFISVQPVPNGVSLTRTQYWTPVFDLSQFVTKAAINFANTYERDITTTATTATGAGDWVVWNSTLYVALTSIHEGDAYVVNGNIKRMTVEDFYDLLMETIRALDDRIDDEIQNRQDADSALGDRIDGRIDDEIRDREDADTALSERVGNLTDLTTVNKSSIVNAINEINTEVIALSNITVPIIDVTEYGVVGDGVTDDSATIQTLINDYAGKATLYFPANKVYSCAAVFIKSNTHLIIDGTIKLYDGANTQLLTSYSESNVIIEGCGTLDGNKANQNSNLAIACILFGDSSDTIYNVNNVLVRGITIQNALYWGACAIGNDITFDKVIFANNEYMSFIGPHSKRGVFRDCVAYGVTNDWGLGFYGGVDGGVIDGCVAFNNNQTGLGALSDIYQPTPSNDIVITNCVCYSNGFGVAVGGWSGVGTNIRINNNVIKNSTAGTFLNYGGIFIANTQRATVSDNVIDDIGAVNAYTGILLIGENTDVDVNHNVIKFDDGWGVYVGGTVASRIKVNDNDIYSTNDNSIGYYASTVVANQVFNNLLYGTLYIPFSGGTAIHVRNNTYDTAVSYIAEFVPDGVETTFSVTNSQIGLFGDIATAIIMPAGDYGSTPAVSHSATTIAITYPTAPSAGYGQLKFEIYATSVLY